MSDFKRAPNQFKITKVEVLSVILFYLFFSWMYHITLWYNGDGFTKDGIWGWLDLKQYWLNSGWQYLFNFLASIIIWFIGIWLLKNKSTRYQIITVFILIPISIYFFREFRYAIIDYLKLWRLLGTGAIWDWYIPTLFLYIQFGCFFAYRYFKENELKLQLEGELRQAALKSELSAIKAQLNPHFLYNVFNTINASLPAENEKTRDMIAQLADLFRYQLQATKQELVPLQEELEFVKKYLDLEKARFEDRLNIEINVADEILNEEVPPMILQPIVENCVKHGLSTLIEGGTINISIYKNDGKLKFEISDNGIGVDDKNSLFGKGVGLTNTKLRLQKMYNSTLEVLDNKPKGLKIVFSI